MFKLVALDVDGTITSPSTDLSDYTQKIIIELVRRGVAVTLATGKQYEAIKTLLMRLALKSPQITADGAVIVDPIHGKVIYKKGVPRKYSISTIEIAKNLDATVVVARDGKTFTCSYNKDIEYMLSFGDPYPIFMDDLNLSLSRLPSHIMIITYNDIEKFHLVEQRLHECLKDNVTIAKSSPFYIEVVNHSVSKGNGLKKVSNLMGIKKDEIIAIGDGENDISMFEYAGFSVAMGNSSEKVKSKATDITDDCKNDGAARVLARLFNLA